MNMIRSAIFVLFSTLALATFSFGPASAQTGANCLTLSQTIDALNQTGPGVVTHVYDGEDAQMVRDWLAAKYANGDINSVIEFDVIVLAEAPTATTAYSVAFKDGCSVAQGPVTKLEFDELVKLLGK